MRTVRLPSHNPQFTTDEHQTLPYLSEAEEETDATTQLEGIVDCSLQPAHASRTVTPSFTVAITAGSLQHHKCFSAQLLQCHENMKF
jgi:hypothetical protein